MRATPPHVELYLDSLVLELGPEGRPDEAAVRQALGCAFEQALSHVAEHDRTPQPTGPAAVAAGVVARRVVHEVGEAVPPC